MNIGTLTGAIALEDQLSSQLTIISGRVQRFAEGFDNAFGTIAIGAGVAIAAIGAITGAIVGLGVQGSTILDVEESFDRLAKQAGSTGEALISGLSKGVHGTVDSMELMTATTRALQAGVKLTEADMVVLGETARAMGKATGKDATSGLQTLSSALVTGRTRGLALAGVVVDIEGAERKLAAQLGVTSTQLSQAGKLQAARTAIMEAARTKLDQLGVSEVSFKEKIQAGQVAIGNWFDSLKKAVAVSPQVNNALDSIGSAFVKAFGGGSQTLLETVVKWINRFADAAARWGPVIIQTVADIGTKIYEIWQAVMRAWDAVPGWFKQIAAEALVAGVAVGVVHQGISLVTGGDLLTTVASFATIWSGFGKALTGAAVAMKAFGLSLAFATEVGGVSLAVRLLGASFAGLLATPLGAAAAITAFGYAVVKLHDFFEEGGHGWLPKGLGLISDGLDRTTLSLNRATVALKSWTGAMDKFDLPRKTDNQVANESAVNAGFVDRTEVAKAAAEAEKKYVDLATKAEALLAAESVATTATYVRTVDKRLAASAAWREEQNKRGIAMMRSEADRIAKNEEMERAAINELGVLNLNAQAERMALLDQNSQAERALLNELNVDKMNAQAQLMVGTKAMAVSTTAFLLQEYNRIKDAGIYTADIVEQAWEDWFNSMEDGIKPLGASIKKNFETALSGVGDIITQAFTGGGGVIGALKAIGVQMAEALAAPFLARLGSFAAKAAGLLTGALKIGGAATASAAGGGAAAGGATAGIGLGAGLATAGIATAAVAAYVGIKKLMAQRKEIAGNRLRDDIFAQMGNSLKELNPRIQRATGSLQLMENFFKAKGKEQVAAAYDAINVALTEYQVRTDAALEANDTLALRMQDMIDLSPEMADSFEMAYDAQTPEDFLAAIGDINTAIDEQVRKQDFLTSTLDKYGIAWTSVGEKGRAAFAAVKAGDFAKEFEALHGAGVNINEIWDHMGDNVSDFVLEVKKSGTEMPEAFKGILQTAIDSGEIFTVSTAELARLRGEAEKLGKPFDDTAFKVDDLAEAGVIFGTTMETATQNVASAIDRLGEKIEDLSSVIQGIPDVDVNINLRERRIPSGGPTHGYEMPEYETPEYAASGGYVTSNNVIPFKPRGTDTVPAMLTPGETIIPAGGMGGGTIVVPVYLDGRKVAEGIVTHFPGAVERMVGR